MNAHWLLLVLIAPFLWAIATTLDGMIRHHYVRNDWVLSWLSTFLRLPFVLFFLLLFGFEFPGWTGVWMIATGMLWTFMFVPYFMALEHEETSRVALFLSSLSIFNFIFAYFLLGETLSARQGVAFIIIFVGGALAGLKRLEGLWRLSRAFWLMLLASLFWALSDVMFKKFSFSFTGFMPAFTLFLVGSFLTVFPLLILPVVRRSVHDFPLLKLPPRAWIMLFISALVGIMGSLAFSSALVSGKVALTSVLTETQPLFVFMLTVVLSRFFHDIRPEVVTKESLFFKGVSFVTVCSGLIYLYF